MAFSTWARNSCSWMRHEPRFLTCVGEARRCCPLSPTSAKGVRHPMAEPLFENPEDLRRQVRGHVQSLRTAGVEWLPVGSPVELLLGGDGGAPSDASSAAPAPTVEIANAAPPASLDQRRQALQMLAAEVKACTCCAELASTRTQTVFGVGPPGVELCFVGEAPGA